MKKLSKGFFFVFEGIDGSGKTTHLKYAKMALEREGFPVLATREPGGTVVAEKIRSLILEDTPVEKLCQEAELLLFLAARAQHVKNVVLPSVRSKNIVLCDRFLASTFAYQVYAQKVVNEAMFFLMNSLASYDLKPDFTFFFDVEVKEGLRRATKKREINRIDKKSIEFHQAVKKGFEGFFSKMPEDSWEKINTKNKFEKNKDKVIKRILEVITASR